MQYFNGRDLESTVTEKLKLAQIWLSQFFAVAVLCSVALAATLSVAHQVDADMHASSLSFEEALVGSDADNGNVQLESDYCVVQILCHSQVALLGEMDSSKPFLLAIVAISPDSVLSLDGRTLDVVTPPPLALCA